MKVIDNKHIDKKKYEQQLLQFACTEAAMQPWVLDAVSPAWGMLAEKTGDYLMPLPIRYKFLLPYTTMPVFGQRFDILSTCKSEIVPRIVKFLKREFVRGNININVSGLLQKKFKVRQTFQQSLLCTYDRIWDSMSDNHKRNITRAENLNSIVLSPDRWQVLADMKKDLLNEKKVKFSEFDQSCFSKLVEFAVLQHNSPFYVAIQNNNVVAAALFVKINNRFIIESATTPEGRRSLAAYALINHFIKEHAGKDLLLDYAGSNIPSIATFRKGFGATRYEYSNIQWRWI